MSFQIINNDYISTVNLDINSDLTGKIALGYQTGMQQGSNAIAIGNFAGNTGQKENSVAIGVSAGSSNLGSGCVAIGRGASGFHSSALNFQVSVGEFAGATNQGQGAIAIGLRSGGTQQGQQSIAIGYNTAQFTQGFQAIAIGRSAANLTQGQYAIAIGSSSGSNTQGQYAIAVGNQSGVYTQGQYAIAIGNQAGLTGQGQYSISVGNQAGITNQHTGSIILNASASALNSIQIDSFYVNPVRSQGAGTTYSLLMYDDSTKEILKSNTATSSFNKTFVIEHPFQEEKYLVHSCLEGPEAGVYYRGKSEIVNDEFVDIVLPEYTNSFSDFTVQITPISRSNNIYCSEVENGRFRVYGNNGRFFWTAFGLREQINVEPLKSEFKLRGDGPYKYLEPNY